MTDNRESAPYNPSSGVIDGDMHTLVERVYFEHTDFSGVVYHARYLDFMEHGRSDFVRMLGVHHSEMIAGRFGEPLAFAVHRMELDFRAAARIDDVLTIKTQRGTLKGMRLTFNQTILRGEKPIVEALVTVVLITPEGRPRRFPAELLALMKIDG